MKMKCLYNDLIFCNGSTNGSTRRRKSLATFSKLHCNGFPWFMCPSIPSFNIRLKQASGYLNFWRLARLNSLPPGAQMPHPRGGFDTFFFFPKRKNLQAWLSSHWPNFTPRARTMDKYPWVAWWTGCWKFELIGALRRNGLSWSISKTANWTTHI